MYKSVSFIQHDPPFWTKTSWIQLGYGVWINLTVIGFGLAYGFTSVALPQFHDDNSQIKLTVKDEATIASVLTLFAPIGSLLCGILMDRHGRKIALVLCEIPIAAGWFYIGFASNAQDIIIGRIISGVGLGMLMVAPRAYITEITLPNMRGVLGALPSMATSIGLTAQAGLGAFLSWYILCYISGAYSLVVMFLNLFLPDTPHYAILTTTASNARIVLKKFRSAKFNIDDELKELAEFKADNDIRRLTPLETLKALFKPSSCKPFGIVFFYIILTQLVGVNVVIMWSVEMLELSKSSIDPFMGNIYLSLTRIFAGIITSWLLFKVKRRAMALMSAVGLGIVAILLGLFLHTYDVISPYPQMFFTAYVTFATLGYYTLPFLIMFETLPLQVRGIMSGILLSVFSLSMFGMNLVYPTMRNNLGLANVVIVYGTISLLGAIILYIILPETKDLTLQEIEEYFNSRRPTLVSQRRVMSLQMQESFKSARLAGSKSHIFFPTSAINIRNEPDDKKHDKQRKHHHGKHKEQRHDNDESKKNEEETEDKERAIIFKE